ncbi:MAG TPA: 50S ribosomal protein L1 [Dehalococcoidia bacterium]|nr:50S ribosomal protein L1 [Dehalococcoidia bacterium]
MPKHGKRYNAAVESYDQEQFFSLNEAVGVLKENATAKFDETVELHVRTGLDPRHADQQVRGTTMLPHGLGKEVRVAVFADADAAKAAEDAGADIIGGEDLIQKVQDGFTEFDIALAERSMMGKVGKLGRVLGPRGLMPNPRAGTVVDAAGLAKAIDDSRKGRVEFRLDRLALMHVPVGKASFDSDKLEENIATVVGEIVKAKPSGTKGTYVSALHLTSTMGPSIKLELQTTLRAQAD